MWTLSECRRGGSLEIVGHAEQEGIAWARLRETARSLKEVLDRTGSLGAHVTQECLRPPDKYALEGSSVPNGSVGMKETSRPLEQRSVFPGGFPGSDV